MCQTEIHKLSFTNIYQSNFPIYVTTQKLPLSPNPLSPLPGQISELPMYPVSMHPLRPLARFLLTGDFHSVPPAPASLIPVPGSGRDGPGHTIPAYCQVFPVPFVWEGISQLISCYLCLLLCHPVHG